MAIAAIVLLLIAPVAANLGSEHTMGPWFQYKQDCGRKSHLKIIQEKRAALLQERRNVPGAGITPFEPFEAVLKDGFMEVDCVKDYMYYRGDKFGDNKYDYKLAGTSNVSIVHYEAFVAKEDQQEMTQKVCFDFCRTVPNMGFFGIVNGRGCYCTPFFKPMESDSSMCDSVCEGKNTMLCGGKSKSSIFAMHMCSSTGEDLALVTDAAAELKGGMDDKIASATEIAGGMQSTGAEVQATLGAAGDGAASDLAQAAKVFAGKIEAQVKAAQAVSDKIHGLHEAAAKLGVDDSAPWKCYSYNSVSDEWCKHPDVDGGVIADYHYKYGAPGSFTGPPYNVKEPAWCKCVHKPVAKAASMTDPQNVAAAEHIMEETEEAMDSGKSEEDKLDKLLELATHNASLNASKQYYPVMYFIDKEYVDVPTSCGGDMVDEPMIGSMDACASACDAAIHSCVGFQFFAEKWCVLFSKLESVFYYTGCGGSESFLQMKKKKMPSFEAACMAKLSKFEGTTLKVDKSGETDFGMKEITKAARCY